MNNDKKYIFQKYNENNPNKNYIYGSLSNYYSNSNNMENFETANTRPSAIIYQKESRVCPKKGNNFYFKGVS